ncbi:MAG: Fe-S protein assembly co-chaperone HscB [Alphaproteobacteria bacterium]
MLNFFDILDLPTGFALDEKALEKNYFAAQRRSHPDKLVNAGKAEHARAVEQAQWVNEAYDTLKNPLTRAEHLLLLKGVLVNTDESGPVAPPLLMEMMDLRERIAAASGDGRALLSMVEEVKGEASRCVQSLADAFAADDTARAVEETTRLAYLGKALEEAYMLLFRFKAGSHA